MTTTMPTTKYYRVFHRTWWSVNSAGGLNPCPGRKTTIRAKVTYEDARAICEHWNATHKPGRLSRKAEFEEI